MKIDARLYGLKAYLKKNEGERQKKLDAMDAVMEARANEMAMMAKRLAPKDMGGLAANTGYKRLGYLSFELYSNMFYAPYIEFGTKTYVSVPPELQENAAKAKQQKSKGTFAQFIVALEKWIKRKGIAGTAVTQIKSGKNKGKFRRNKANQERNIFNLAHQIAYIIMKKGIRRQPFIYPAFMMYKNKLISDVAKIMRY